MIKITNVETLGTDYTITDTDGNIIQTVQIISSDEILNAALGEFNDTFGDISEYLEKSIECLSGFTDVDPYKILCWSTTGLEFDFIKAIEYAVQHSYDIIILEYLPPISISMDS